MSSPPTTPLLGLLFGLPIGLAALSLLADPVAVPVQSLPLASEPYVLGDEIEVYADFMMSGGPPPDGIPSIDEPRFVTADRVALEDNDMVIGFAHEGDARAYPQRIVVQHEIVNDIVGGLSVAITYCPLTATAQGFERGETTLGVSGQLLNSNLVMYDRDTGSYFAQIAATGLTGDLEGETLVEVDLVWTTWARWREAHPDTRVLSEQTGYMRNYARDPYGSYNPRQGYYSEDRAIFPLLHDSDDEHRKEMVVGARTSNTSARFVLRDLKSEGVQHTENFVAIYDPRFHTGIVFPRTGATEAVEAAGDGRFLLDGQTYAAHELPLEPLIAVDAFHFAWEAFYPDSERP